MVSNTQGFTDNSPISPGPYVTTKNPSARKPLHKFTEVLNSKKKTAVHQLCDSKS